MLHFVAYCENKGVDEMMKWWNDEIEMCDKRLSGRLRDVLFISIGLCSMILRSWNRFAVHHLFFICAKMRLLCSSFRFLHKTHTYRITRFTDRTEGVVPHDRLILSLDSRLKSEDRISPGSWEHLSPVSDWECRSNHVTACIYMYIVFVWFVCFCFVCLYGIRSVWTDGREKKKREKQMRCVCFSNICLF